MNIRIIYHWGFSLLILYLYISKECKDGSEHCTVEETFENIRKPTIIKETICTQKMKSTIDHSGDLKLHRLTAPPPPSIRLRSPEPPPLKR